MDLEDRFNIHTFFFDDLEMFAGEIATIPEDVPVYALDGRFADFDGDYDLTPGAEEFCSQFDNVFYCRPPDDMLPFGDPEKSAHRDAQHQKARWASYEVLPEDQWTLQMDTDERLLHINRDIFDDFQDDFRYRPTIPIDDGRTVTQPRIWKPKHWTLWIDDCAIPRHIADRDTPLEDLRRLWSENRDVNMEHVDPKYIQIFNFGSHRPLEYQERRVTHLERIKRGTRADQLRKTLDEVDTHGETGFDDIQASSPEEVFEHYSDWRDGVYRCPDCWEKFTDIDEYHSHLRGGH